MSSLVQAANLSKPVRGTLSSSEGTKSASSSKRRKHWSDKETRTLLVHRLDLKDDFDKLGKHGKKKELWEKVHSACKESCPSWPYDIEAMASKYDRLCQAYKEVSDGVKKSGAGSSDWPWLETMDQIHSDKVSIHPPNILDTSSDSPSIVLPSIPTVTIDADSPSSSSSASSSSSFSFSYSSSSSSYSPSPSPPPSAKARPVQADEKDECATPSPKRRKTDSRIQQLVELTNATSERHSKSMREFIERMEKQSELDRAILRDLLALISQFK